MAGYTDQYVSRVPRRPSLGRLHLALALEVVFVAIVLAVLRFTIVGFVVAAVLVSLVVFVVVPFGGNTALQWIRLRFAYRMRQRHKVHELDVPSSLVPLAEWVPGLTVMRTLTGRGGEVGVITDGKAWSAVLGLAADDLLIADTGEEFDLDSLTSLTVQDDVVFDGVQLVTYTVPAPTAVLLGEGSAAAASYREILGGDEPPPTVRRSWLSVRLDPRKCLSAVARRGAGVEGINATMRFGLHRAQSVLKRQGIETRALDPIEIYEVLSLTTGAGQEPVGDRTTEGWSSWTCDSLEHRGQLVSDWGENASRGYARLLDAVAGAPVLFAVTSFTLGQDNRASGAIRLACPSAESAASAIGRLSEQLGGDIKLMPPGGQQVPAVLATVPFGRGADK